MSELVKKAEYYDESFASEWLKQTSVAATILRRNGHEVKYNTKEKEVNDER